MFKISNLTKKFKLEKDFITVFEDLSFEIEKGEWISLTGSSGCGKTTLLHLLGGIDQPTDGHILFNDKDFSSLNRTKRAKLRRKNIGFVFQSFNLFPELNAIENVMLPASVAGLPSRKAEQKAQELLKEVGLDHRVKHRPAELSGGEQQRVAIARALMMEPDVLLADEPTGNLDDDNSLEIMKIFQNLHQDKGKTIIMVTHQKELTRFASRSIFLKDGKIIEK